LREGKKQKKGEGKIKEEKEIRRDKPLRLALHFG
jgi:hypothetical protein